MDRVPCDKAIRMFRKALLFDKEPLLVLLSDRADAPPIPRLYYSRYHGSKKGVYRSRIVPAAKCTTEPQQADSGQPGLKNLQTAHEFSPVHEIQHQCHGKRSGFAERQRPPDKGDILRAGDKLRQRPDRRQDKQNLTEHRDNQ